MCRRGVAEVDEHLPGRGVRPVDVVHDEHQTGGLAGQRGQKLGHGQGKPARALLLDRFGRAEHRRQPGRQRGEQRGGPAGAGADPFVYRPPLRSGSERRYASIASRSGAIGTGSSGAAVANSAVPPSAATRAAISRASRVLPLPLPPRSTATPPSPRRAACQRPVSAASSAARPIVGSPCAAGSAEYRRAGDERAQVGGQIGAGLVPVVRLLGQQRGDDRREGRRGFRCPAAAGPVGGITACARSSSPTSEPTNGGVPARHSYSTTPSEYRSERWSTGRVSIPGLLRRRVEQRADGRVRTRPRPYPCRDRSGRSRSAGPHRPA